MQQWPCLLVFHCQKVFQAPEGIFDDSDSVAAKPLATSSKPRSTAPLPKNTVLTNEDPLEATFDK